ncbi:MAG TPA: SsgA family sporulation/cell division regulator [Pseudonocardiaceae bacterium]|nr:SsgA family sporulation/cell division regulator [Pseudonocardiaceae bacterium]
MNTIDPPPTPGTPEHTRISALIVARLRQGPELVPVRVELSWHPGDPHAIHATFQTARTAAKDVRWVLGRELLAQGLHIPTGIGDVHLCPRDPRGTDPAVTVLELCTPTGHAVFELDTDELAELLADTYAHLPFGHEALFLDLDTEITQLLEEDIR